MLVALNPAATAAYDAALAQAAWRLNRAGFVRRGAAVGARVAKEVLAWRQNDGWVVPPFPPYSEPLLPGRWQPTPPANAVAAFTHVQQCRAAGAAVGHAVPAAPAAVLTSARYAADLNEVKLIGKSDSTMRTPEQTAIARLWAGIAATGIGTATHFVDLEQHRARRRPRARGCRCVETARLFALVNVSDTRRSSDRAGQQVRLRLVASGHGDSSGRHRPQSRDRGGSEWLPLITTPPYPSYAGNMATIGASAARALQLAFGTNNIPVTATWRQSGGLAGRVASLRRVLGSGPGAVGQPHLRRDTLPIRSRGGPGHREGHCRVRLRELHDAHWPGLVARDCTSKPITWTQRGAGVVHHDTDGANRTSQAVASDLKGRVRGPLLLGRHSGIRRGARGLERDDRPAAGADCALPRRRRRDCRSRTPRASTACRCRSRAAATTLPGWRCATAA